MMDTSLKIHIIGICSDFYRLICHFRLLSYVRFAGEKYRLEKYTICAGISGDLNSAEVKNEWDQDSLFRWLIDKWKAPSGKERKNNPFGPLEQEVLKNFERAVVDEYGEYRVYDNRGNWFGYDYKNGQISIIDISYSNMESMNPLRTVVEALIAQEQTTHEYYFLRGNEQLKLEREALHKEIVHSILSRKPYSQNKRVFMLGGAPANGKSSLIRSGFLPHPEAALKVDVDEIKYFLPEYRYMVEAKEALAATLVHEESANIGHELRQIALQNGYDLIWDGIGNESLEHRKAAAEEFKSYGHYSRVDYVTLDTPLSLELAELRYQKTGRRVPETFIKDKNRDIAALVPEIIKHQVFDELYLWDTNIHNTPRLILSQKNGKLEVVNESLYNNFKMKAHVKGIIQTEGQYHQKRKKSHRL